MKIKLLLTVIFAANIFFVSCGKTNETPETVKTELSYEQKNFYKSYKDCDTANAINCTYIKFYWIEYTSGNIKSDLNSFINSYMLDSMYGYEETTKYASFEAIADTFLNSYGQFVDETPDYDFGWYTNLSCTEQYRSNHVVVLNMSSEGFTGGAHGYATTFYFNFSREDGSLLKLSDILKPGFEDELNKLVDAQYRADNGLSDTANLATEGNLFENEIKFNDNFCLTKDGILFFYNQYEIAPYAVGQIEVLIRYDKLGDLLKQKDIMN